jgi:acyl carrier protein
VSDPAILDRTRRIVATVFDIPTDLVLPESSPDNLENWDSIQHLNLVIAMEQEFGIQFTPEEMEQMLSVELIAALLEEKLKGCEATHGR